MSDAPLFHGTHAELEPGDIINPTYRGVACATHSVGTARVFAQPSIRFGGDGKTPGHVYEVEPVNPESAWEQEMKYSAGEEHFEVLCPEGFRVIKRLRANELGTSSSQADIIAAFLADDSYQSVEDWARDSDFHRTDACEDGIWIDEYGAEIPIVAAIEMAMEASGFLGTTPRTEGDAPMAEIIVSAGHNEYSIRQIDGITTRDLWDPTEERTDQGAFMDMLRSRGMPDDIIRDWDLGYEWIVEISYVDRHNLVDCLQILLDDLGTDPGGDDGTFDYWPSGMRLAMQINEKLGGDATSAIQETANRVIYGMGRDDFASELYDKIGLPDPKYRERGEEIGISGREHLMEPTWVIVLWNHRESGTIETVIGPYFSIDDAQPDIETLGRSRCTLAAVEPTSIIKH